MDQEVLEVRKQLKSSYERLSFLTKSHETKQDYTMLVLWGKLLKNSEAILLLIENGLKDEALAIQRLSLEHLFNFFAMACDDKFHNEFLNSSQHSLAKGMKVLARSIDSSRLSSLDQESRSNLESAIILSDQNITEFMGYSIYNAANKSQLGPMYDSLYRTLSLSYAHSTFVSILVKAPEENTELLDQVAGFLSLVYQKSFEVWSR
ncbi:DUF5677 domain-containing protein [Vibrio vulnificus]|nr:DUF5677 domain-containing protein [Vibrio vulnificus]